VRMNHSSSFYLISPFADPDPSKNNYESQEENNSSKRVDRPKKEVVDSKGGGDEGKMTSQAGMQGRKETCKKISQFRQK
jgi:hypothetical protein